MTSEPLYSVRNIKTLKDMIEQSDKLFGDKDAFLIKTSNNNYRGVKYRELKNDVDALGTSLISLGLKGKFVAVMGENRYEWCVSYLAAVNGTGRVVPLDKELPPSETENLLIRSNASVIIFSGKFAQEMKRISLTMSSIRYFINMDSEEDENGFLSFRRLVEKGRELIASGDRSFIDTQVDAEEASILLFTSGTTDLAKGVMLSQKNICSNIMAVCSSIHVTHKDSVLSILPLHHTYECTCGFLLMLYNGCTISFNEGLKHIAKNLKETKPTILFLVPLILEGMYRKVWEQAGKKRGAKTALKAAIFVSNVLYNIFRIDIRKMLFKAIHENIGGRIRLIISGAAALEPNVSKGFRSMGINVLQGYGLTECSPIVTVNREFSLNDSSIGQPIPGVDVRINNPGNDGIGEITVKGDNVMLGYYENELATEKCLKSGWFYTGDLAYMDKSGFFHITGRKKNVIVTKNGKKIYPEEVEAYLNKSEYILESLVWGKYDEDSGETLVNAQIVPNIEFIKSKLNVNEVLSEEIFTIINAEVKLVNRDMPLYKRIRQFTLREQEFAKTTTKKIKRYVEKTG